MSDTDSEAAGRSGREPGGAWVPPRGAPGQPAQGDPGQPAQGDPGQPAQGDPGQPAQGEPGPPRSWPPPPGEAGPPPPPGSWPPPPSEAAQPMPAGPWPPTPPRRRAGGTMVALIAAAAVLVAGLGVGWGYATTRLIHSFTSGAQSPIHVGPQFGGSSSGLPAQSGQAGKPLDVQAVATKVSPAIVDINTAIASVTGRTSQAAGTGMILTSNGEVLTNNHVIEQSSSIRVTIPGRSSTYPVTVVGVDPTADVALLQVQGVSGLPTVQLADSSTLSVGQAVVALGNALGQGGPPSVTRGTITALDQTITASSDNGSSEQLRGLIESDATISPGDSGGALANAAGQVIGMITAGQATGFRQSSTNVGYAIPANTAAGIVDEIRAGHASSTILIGPTGHLGIGVRSLDSITATRLGLGVSSGALVTGVEPGSPADQIGLTTNSVVTSIDGASINSPGDLTPAIQGHKPGDRIRVTWVDRSGTHTATATLVAGPAA